MEVDGAQHEDGAQLLTSFDHLPADVAARVLRAAGGPACLMSTRSASRAWAAALEALVSAAHLHSMPIYSCSFLLAFPQLSSVDLSGCCEVLPPGGLAELLAGLAALPCLRALALSTWCLAQPAAATAPTAAAGRSASSSELPAASMAPGSAAAAAAAGTVPPFLRPAAQEPRCYRLVVPRELGLLSALQSLVIQPPCPGVSSPGPTAAYDDGMQLCPQVMQLSGLTRLELHSFLPHCHHLRGMPQLQRLAISVPSTSTSSTSTSGGYEGVRAAAAVWGAAAAALGAAAGLTSLQLCLLGPAGGTAAGGLANWAGGDWPPSLDALLCCQKPESSNESSESSSSSAAGAAGSEGRSGSSPSDAGAGTPSSQGQRLQELSVAGAGLWHLPAAIRSCCSGLTSLALSHNRLTEVGLEELGSARQLLQLVLDHNCLRAVPACWAGLTQLQVLDLSANAISLYPAAALSGMGQLQALLLGSNGLAVLPDAVSSLTCLTLLDLSSNRLQELPEALCHCLALRRLNVARNRLVQLPAGLGQLTAITQLDLTGNHLESLPAGLNNMRQIEHVSLGLNYWKTWSNLHLQGLTSLQLLELQHTATCLADAAGFLAAVGRLTMLTQLCCSNNQLAQLPQKWSALTGLQVLRVAHNALEELPPVLLMLPGLSALDISYNRLRCLQPWVSALTGLRQFSAARNHLTSLPTELAGLSRLSQLQLQGNNLAAVPPCLGRMAGLRALNVGSNYKLKEAGLAQLLQLPGLRDVVLPYRLRDVGEQLRAAGKAVVLE